MCTPAADTVLQVFKWNFYGHSKIGQFWIFLVMKKIVLFLIKFYKMKTQLVVASQPKQSFQISIKGSKHFDRPKRVK